LALFTGFRISQEVAKQVIEGEVVFRPIRMIACHNLATCLRETVLGGGS
jgi:hypothetical protein